MTRSILRCILGVVAFVLALGVVPAPAAVRYQVFFEATWSEETHPTDFPPNAHFSQPVGGMHNADVTFWEPGGIASDGIEAMAELGATVPLLDEVQAAIDAGTADATVLAPDLFSPGTSVVEIDVDRAFSRLSLVTMVAPSPDWFAGLSGLALFEHGRWRERISVVAFAYDAGTDNGASYLSGNSNTVPRDPIVRITTPPLADAGGYQPPIGSFTVTLVSVDGRPPREDADGDGLDNLRENEIGTNPLLSDTDDDGLTDAVDNCPLLSNASQIDTDGDGSGDGCDNCALDHNPGQSDVDVDAEGDACDLDDGMIYVRFDQTEYVEWQEEAGYTAWNLYRGDLGLLRNSGLYTQDPATTVLAEQVCEQTLPRVLDLDPGPGEAVFFLVTGLYPESDLGEDGDGQVRPHANPCP